MLRRAATTALILLVSTCLLPQASIAMEGNKTIQIGHLGDKIEATVEISSGEGRMSAVPFIRIKEDPIRADTASAESSENAKKAVAGIIPDGEISLSRGRNLLDQAREAIKKWKTDKSEMRNASLRNQPSGRAGTDAAEDLQVADDHAAPPGQTIDLCKNCNFRLMTETFIF